MTDDNSDHLPKDQQETADLHAKPTSLERLRRLLLRPPALAAVVLAAIVGLYAALNSAFTASSLPKGFASAADATYPLITPTATTCSQFSSGQAGTLSSIAYSTKNGKISQTNPGVFYYWVAFPVTQGSTYTVTIGQTTNPSYNHFFAIASGSAVYNSSCTVVLRVSSSTFTFTASTTGTYFIGIKYSTSSVDSSPPPSGGKTTYTFTTNGGFPASIQLAPKQ
jgi:hypothetical protein